MWSFGAVKSLLLLGLLIGAGHASNGRSGWKVPRRRTQSGRVTATPSLLPSPALGVEPQSHSVTVQCEEKEMLVRVSVDLFGSGYLVNASHLKLGLAYCGSSQVDSDSRTIVFRTLLHQCGTTRTLTADSLVYKTSLYYLPTAEQIVIRTNPVTIPIECRYPRKGNVSSKVLKPTWAPFSSTRIGQDSLKFSLALMNENWSNKRDSNIYYLGDEIHIEASVVTLNHAPLKLFIDRCVATLSSEQTSNPRYTIIDHSGCLLDSKAGDSTSTFVSPRDEEDKVRFILDAFRFYQDSRSSIFITCHLRVSALDQSPDPLNKACWFHRSNRTWSLLIDSWAPVGQAAARSICRCCNTGKCGSPLGARGKRRASPGAEVSPSTWEADPTLGPLVILESNGFISAGSRFLGRGGEKQQVLPDGLFMAILAGLGAVMILISGAVAVVAYKSSTESRSRLTFTTS